MMWAIIATTRHPGCRRPVGRRPREAVRLTGRARQAADSPAHDFPAHDSLAHDRFHWRFLAPQQGRASPVRDRLLVEGRADSTVDRQSFCDRRIRRSGAGW
jgi:hypothetical protein